MIKLAGLFVGSGVELNTLLFCVGGVDLAPWLLDDGC